MSTFESTRREGRAARLGPDVATTIEPPPRGRLVALCEAVLRRGPLPAPGLPRGVPPLVGSLPRPPSLLLVGEALSASAAENLRRRGFRKVIDVEDLPDALGALSERRYDAIAIWDHVEDKPVRFARSLLSFEGRAEDTLLPLLASRVRRVPIAVLHSTGGYAVLTSGGAWYLSEAGGPSWVEALLALVVSAGNPEE